MLVRWICISPSSYSRRRYALGVADQDIKYIGILSGYSSWCDSVVEDYAIIIALLKYSVTFREFIGLICNWYDEREVNYNRNYECEIQSTTFKLREEFWVNLFVNINHIDIYYEVYWTLWLHSFIITYYLTCMFYHYILFHCLITNFEFKYLIPIGLLYWYTGNL